MRIGIVARDANEFTTALLIRAVQGASHTPVLVKLSDVVSVLGMPDEGIATEHGMLELDGIIVRDVGAGRCEEVGFRMDCLARLEGIPIINSPETILRCASKHLAHHALARAHVPTPPTVATQSVREALRWIERMGDVVLKPPHGYEGRGIVRVRMGQPDVEQRVAGLVRAHGSVLVQQYVPSVGDLRVLVVGEEVAGCVRRVPAEGKWLSNIAQGGRAIVTSCTPTLRRLALSSTRAVGAAFAGVDIVQHVHTGELFVLEVNATPSFRSIVEECHTDPAPKVVELLTH
ncbi:ATP-grasp domain-containing protein [Methermicoccus shengliensis]|uniref:RimK family alpha-L-glutamate ligase n=1 Tax=Methermicoccus shengliensis TaxID=660064 RepID=A0A832RXC5_9EURY|nr:RimK family alpha-L-glutamate ligase [Methermicoccus shengliensis]KUK04020.1 MAG: Alpha-L-glutamate ligase, RimK family [Euryarchaeota archaeon 55_53]KUK29747.1 MAG: Alpha-L-glutamate ligase, RimK family [Methanosarcinales archeaon 56_1174]MDI3488543.1 tetrahydromethanopterin:alpha-L-glutamate ligase [Methanosarcinales archaeon]MDN5295864.1 tetrahydromethanopterin:alpha-L-glutamate ligase [Methanosarcinales archaeon]HIH69938.1 RimK family alpha-L-glutamate ligase [Methermicoccus shengliensi